MVLLRRIAPGLRRNTETSHLEVMDLVTRLSDRLQAVLEETGLTRREFVREMGYISAEKGLALLEGILDEDHLPGTQQEVERLSKVLDGSVDELNMLIQWEYQGKHLDRIEQHRKQHEGEPAERRN